MLQWHALCGLAALTLVLFHCTALNRQHIGQVQPLGFDFAPGNYGLLLFLLTCGFMIFTILENPARSGGDPNRFGDAAVVGQVIAFRQRRLRNG